MARRNDQAAEARRLREDSLRVRNWTRWGPYLSERQWGTVREDYSPDGDCWNYFTHEQARSRAYRWGEDGLLGICDRECRLCFALALWNGRDSILKERLFGLTNPQGNHGEDVKEQYFYVDSTPTHSYMKGVYKYPQAEFPYQRLLDEARRRTTLDPEFELLDTGIFDAGRYFDVVAEYAKASPNDILIRITAANRGPEPATLHLLPTLWFRNTWTWGCMHEGCTPKPRIERIDVATLMTEHLTLGRFRFAIAPGPDGHQPDILLTENETNTQRLFGSSNPGAHVKDAFHEYVVHGRTEAVSADGRGTKAAAHYVLSIPPGEQAVIRLRLVAEQEARGPMSGVRFDRLFRQRIREAEAFYASVVPRGIEGDARNICRQAYAGLLWSKQFYHYVVKDWLAGDPNMPPPPEGHKHGRNADWTHLFNRDVISVPDKWEYPWYAAWDLAFHMIPFARIHPEFAKAQLILMTREWYMHPNGQFPAYEFSFSDVDPAVHAWACWRVYKMTGPRGKRDRLFLARTFQKLMLNFTWWVNRKDVAGRHIFSGGFLGLDNIGLFDRSRPLPAGGALEQADGTAWIAFFCGTLLSMALELATRDPAYEDVASKFFEHYLAIVDAMNSLGGCGLWDEQDGFYYDRLSLNGQSLPLKVRSVVGLIPLVAVELLNCGAIRRLPGFAKRMRWFIENRGDLARHITWMETCRHGAHSHYLLAIPSLDRLKRLLGYLLDENEFLSPYGIRSLSRVHLERPVTLNIDSQQHCVRYVPGDSDSKLFGGNSNWRGPVWFPVNYLLIEALERYGHFYGDSLEVECPTGSGRQMNLKHVADELRRRLASIFLRDRQGRRPWQGDGGPFRDDPHWRDLVLFHEFFDGDTGRGLGASHQTGWTALISECLREGCS